MNDLDDRPAAPSAGPKRLTKWFRRGRRVLLFAGALYVLALAMLVAFETALVYPRPDVRDGDWTPDGIAYEEVAFASADGTRLHGWLLEHPQPQQVILFFHGNAEHVGYLGDEMDQLRRRFAATVFVFDFRGYGKSEGTPHEAGILADGVAAQRWLAERVGVRSDQITLYGRSLGGGIAVANASTEGAAALVLDRTFDSMVDVAAGMYRWAPVRWLMRNRYPSAERMKHYHGPLCQLHGTVDEIVPYSAGQRLFAACDSDTKQFISVEGLFHNDPPPRDWYAGMQSFLERLGTSLNR